MHQPHYLIPAHARGKETDIACGFTAESIDDASDLFVDAKDRLLAVTDWSDYGSLESVHFRLADSHGNTVRRHARRGDHILVSSAGDGDQPATSFDRYTIEALEYDDYPDENRETFAIRLRPTVSEGADAPNDTATIVIGRTGLVLSAVYHGRNRADTDDDLWHGLEEEQWGMLMKGLLDYYDQDML